MTCAVYLTLTVLVAVCLADITGPVARVHGGSDSLPGQFPYQALIKVYSQDGSSSLCGGALVSDHNLLSAAHCFQPGDRVEVYLGATSKDDLPAAVNVVKVVNHPDYSESTNKNDIAILTIQPITLNDTIQPISLPPKRGRGIFSRIRLTVVVSGWGMTEKEDSPNNMQHRRIKLMSWQSCRRYWPQVGSTQVCAQSAACPGDSGGPLAYWSFGSPDYIVGLTSFGPQKCTSKQPTAYTNVASFLPWIQKETGLTS